MIGSRFAGPARFSFDFSRNARNPINYGSRRLIDFAEIDFEASNVRSDSQP